MSVILDLAPEVLANLRVMVTQTKRKSVKLLCKEIIEDIASANTAYILLNPAPPPEVYGEVAEAVGEVLKKHSIKETERVRQVAPQEAPSGGDSDTEVNPTQLHIVSGVSDKVSTLPEL